MCTSHWDPDLYTFQEAGSIIFLLIYVDNLLLISNQPACLGWLQQQLCIHFTMSIFGLLALYLGVDFISIPLTAATSSSA
jgi:hypothetical protein